MLNKVREMNFFERINISFSDCVKKYHLEFLPSYLEDYYNGRLLRVKESVTLDSLEIDDIDEMGGTIILFEKDLIIENALTQSNVDYGPTVIVKGNVSAKNIAFGGACIIIKGDVTVEQTMIGIYNHGVINITGKVTAEYIISDDHCFSIYDKGSKGIFLGFQDLRYHAKDVLSGKYYDDAEENIKIDKIIEAIKKGNSIKKNGNIVSQVQKAIDKFKASKNAKLNLSNLNLTEIPEEIFQLENIKELDLSNNPLKELSLKGMQTDHLKSINLACCSLTEFPIDILNINQIESIDLSFNTISSLPEELPVLNQLKKLLLSHCNFTEFPCILYQVVNLEYLDLGFQDEETLFLIDKALQSLKVLLLSGNANINITAPQPKLYELNISHCLMDTFPIALTKSTHLTHLDMSYNHKMRWLPDEFSELKKLKKLSFSILYMEESHIKILQKLPKLQYIANFLKSDNPFYGNQVAQALLAVKNWNTLVIDSVLEDQTIIDAIVLRENLKKFIMGEYEVDIKEARQCLGVSF